MDNADNERLSWWQGAKFVLLTLAAFAAIITAATAAWILLPHWLTYALAGVAVFLILVESVRDP